MPRVRVGVAVIQDGRLLLITHRRRGLTYWVVPGGEAGEREGAPACARREIQEETGLEITVGPLTAVFEIYDAPRERHDLNLLFIGNAEPGRLTLPSGGPSVESLDRAAFIDRAALGAIDLRPAKLRSLLERLLSGERPAAEYLGDLSDEIPPSALRRP
jgi:8-oxo-dGTP diphosphatase